MLQYEASTSAGGSSSIQYAAAGRPLHFGPGYGPPPAVFLFGGTPNRPAATVAAAHTVHVQRPSATAGLGSPGLPNVPMDRSKRKPKMEKERRDKINLFLAVLKDKLIANHIAKNSKLEKTDILEHTIKYIERLESERTPAHGPESAQQTAAETALRVVHTSLAGAIAHAGLADDSRTPALVAHLTERLGGALAAPAVGPPAAKSVEKPAAALTVEHTRPSAFSRPHKSIATKNNNNNNLTTNLNNNWISQSHPAFLVPPTVAGLAPHMATWLMTAGYFSGQPGRLAHPNRLPASPAYPAKYLDGWPAGGPTTNSPMGGEPDEDVDVLDEEEDDDDDTTASTAGDDSGLGSGGRPEASDTSGLTHSPEPPAQPVGGPPESGRPSAGSIGPIRGRDGGKPRARPIWCPYRDK